MEDTDRLQHLAKGKDSLDIREHSWKVSHKVCRWRKVCINHEVEIYRNHICYFSCSFCPTGRKKFEAFLMEYYSHICLSAAHKSHYYITAHVTQD